MPNWNDPESIRKWLDEKNKQKFATADPYRNSSNWYGAPASASPRPQLQPLPTPTPIIQQPGLQPVQMQGAPRPQNNTGISSSAPNSPTVAMRPQGVQQRPSTFLPQTQSGAFSYNPVPRGSITDGTWKPADAWNWMTEGINNTPAMKYTENRVETRKDDGDQWYDAILNGVDRVLDAPGRALVTQPLLPNMAQVFQNGAKKGEDWFSISDVSSALGSFYNKAYDLAVKQGPNFFNPLNPEGLNATFLDPKNNLMSHVAEEVQRSVDFKKSILALPPQQRAVAEMVIANNITGLNGMQDSYKAFEEKATMPAVWRQQAQELAAKAQAGGLPDQVATNMMRQASVLWNRAQEIEAKSYSQIIDEHQNFRSELVMGILFDPTDWITAGAVSALGLTHEALTAATMARKMNISPEAAIKAMEAAVADASPLVSRVLGGGNVFDTKSAWAKINPFARTSETLAHMDTNELFKAAVPLFAGLHGGSRVDAVKVLTDWLGTAGQKIVQGMPIGSMQNLADSAGNVRFGPGLLGNEDVVKRFPILKIVEKQLMEMGSLKGDGLFRVDEFLSEFRRITQTGADLYYGVATNTLKKAAPAVGKKAAKEAITYKSGSTLADGISVPSNVMRAIMSDMWLNSRPGHWIRNGASASTQLLAKGLYTWRSIEDIATNYARRLGVPIEEALKLMPTLRTTDAMGGVPSIAENTENFTRKFWPNNNPYAGLMEWGAQKWGGTTQLLNNIPVAEQSLYLTGLDRGMERAFRQYWSMAISQQIAPLFESMGVAPDLTKKFIGEIIDAGNSGAGKKEIIDGFRQTVEKSTITTTLTDLGVPEELITDAKVRQELAQVFRALTPMNLAESEEAIRGLFARLRIHPGAVLNDAAPMPEDVLGSKDTIVADIASYIDDMERTAKAGGIDPQSTKAFMQVMAKDMTTVQSEGLKNMLADFARATDPTAAGSVMVETFSALVERQQMLRQMMDASARKAIEASMGRAPDARKIAWETKWIENQQLIKAYLEDVKGLFASGRTALMSGAPTNPAFNRKAWDDLIDRYVKYDPVATNATRDIVTRGPHDSLTSRVIEAHRKYLDEAMVTLMTTAQWIAKQGNPASTEDALTHIQDAWAAINQIGAQTGATVALMRETMLPLQADAFYMESAGAWKQAFERMVTYVHAYRRDALFMHLSHSAPNRLTWKGADGAVYRLEGMMTDGRYLVKNTQTGAETLMNAVGPQKAVDPDVMKFAGDPAKFKASDEVVPSYIVDTYNKVLNNTEEQIDEIIAQVDGVPVTTITEESLQATAKQGGTAKNNAQWAGVESITPPTFKVQEVEPPPAAPFKFPGEEGYTGPASVPTPPVAPKVDMNGVALTTPIQRTELRKAASASGIATAAKSGNPTDKHLLGSIKKRLGWSYTSLDNIPQNRLPAIYEMLQKRADETATAAKLGTPTPPVNVAGDVPLPSVTEVTAPAAKVENIVPTAPGKGKVVKAWTDPTNKYDLQYEVVEYDTLIASHTRNFTENPAFPGELQPRDRSSAISQVDLTKKAASFDPDELLSFGNNLDRGAPILRAADNVVVSGNGRALVVGMISPEKYAAYQQQLIKNANEYGIDPAFIQGMKRPVLVRRQVSDANLANLATEANSRVSQGMNKVEVAGDIAKRLDGNILLAFNQGKYPTLLDALKSGTNQDFLRKFISLVYPTERPTYLDAAGNISQDGVDLIRSSLFHVLFGGKADDLLDNYVMQVASELKVIGNGIEAALGPLAKLEKNLPDLALGADLADAMTLLRDARSNKLNVQQMISQGNMFSSFTPEAELLALLMESNMRSATKIGQALRSYALSAMEAGQGAGQSTLLDVGSPVKIDLLRNAMSGKGAPSLFDEAGFLPPGFMPASNVAKWGQPEELKFLINKNELNINDAYLKLRKSIAQNKAGVKEASMGHYAAQTLKTLDQMEQRILKALPEMAAGTVNNLTPAQRLALFDAVSGKVAPAYDNVLAAASNAGERLANAAMLNFQDRRGTDWILALLFPYHYFWSRTAKNWAAQVLEKPAFLDVWYTTERQIENENRAKDLPTRLQGTLPNPLKEVTGAEWMPDRIGNPFRWMLPFSMYMANEFIDPEDAQSEGEKWMMRMQQYTPGFFPHIRFAIDSYLDNTSPLPDGRKRVQAFELGGTVPLWRIAGYTSQAMGGPSANQFIVPAGDKFDPYRVARWASNNSVPVDGKKPKLTPEVAQYVQQMAINQRDGLPLDQGIPKNFVSTVTAAYQEGLKATAWERLASTAGSFFTGNAGYYYSPEEAKLRAVSQEYNQAGFSPTNPVGSQTAKNTIIDQEPYISPGWTKSMAIPGETGEMPAQKANTGMLHDKRSNLYEQKAAAEDAAIRAALAANPGLKVSEMNKIRADAGAPFQAQIDAVKAEIDGASAGTVPASLMDIGPDTVPTGTPVQMMTPQNAPRELKDAMNPQEQQSVAIGNAFDNARALPGRPADGAPDAEWNNYKAMQQAYVVEQLSDTKMTEAEILKLFDESSNWNRGPAELEVRQNAEERVGATRGAVVSQFGEEAGSVWDAYYALPKGDARSQFAEENPQIKVYNFAAYNPNEYAQASEMFGKDAIMAWAATPPWGESAEAAAKREAYFDANPVVWFVDAWVDGRPREYDPESKPETRNFGADWKEAETLYGEDIWGKVIQWRGADKAGRRELRTADPALDQFIDWWYGLMPQTASTRGGFSSGGSRGGWGGGGGGRGGGYNPYAGQRPPTIYAQDMNKDLWYGPRDTPWRPDRYDDSWRYAGQDIRPEPIKKWKKGA